MYTHLKIYGTRINGDQSALWIFSSVLSSAVGSHTVVNPIVLQQHVCRLRACQRTTQKVLDQ